MYEPLIFNLNTSLQIPKSHTIFQLDTLIKYSKNIIRNNKLCNALTQYKKPLHSQYNFGCPHGAQIDSSTSLNIIFQPTFSYRIIYKIMLMHPKYYDYTNYGLLMKN